ncbi:MAG: AAA family ATPase, partial [Firmicutes bacterium]|nr:AAA family ATPase [Bacillota bacterium]
MPRVRNSYVCRECGYRSPGWLGRCPGCGQWNTIFAEPVTEAGPHTRGSAVSLPVALRLSEVEAEWQERLDTGLGEFNRVLGGGLVPGSVVLLGGAPGVGKSTLLLQSLLRMEAAGVSTLLISGEESPAQIKLRRRRLAE